MQLRSIMMKNVYANFILKIFVQRISTAKKFKAIIKKKNEHKDKKFVQRENSPPLLQSLMFRSANQVLVIVSLVVLELVICNLGLVQRENGLSRSKGGVSDSAGCSVIYMLLFFGNLDLSSWK